jgi:hypothetical protein
MIVYGILAGRFQPFHAGHNEAYLQMCKYFGKDKVYIVTPSSTDDASDPLTIEDKKDILAHFKIDEDKLFVSSGPFRPFDFFQERASVNSDACFVICSYSDQCLKLLKKSYSIFPEDKENLEKFDLEKMRGVYYIKVSTGSYSIDTINIRDGLAIESKETDRLKYLLYLYKEENKELFDKLNLKFGGGMRTAKRDFDDPKYKAWRSSVFIRDNFTCQLTGKKGELQAHHIERWADKPDLRYDTNNGITLCKEAHAMVTGKEDQYKDQFKDIVVKRLRELNKSVKNIDRAKTFNNHKPKQRKRWFPRSPLTR